MHMLLGHFLFSTSRVEDRAVPLPGFMGSLVFQIVMWWALAGRTQTEESDIAAFGSHFPGAGLSGKSLAVPLPWGIQDPGATASEK